jgi:hypothetical protein
MSINKQYQLSSLSNARRWLELFEAEYPEDGPVPENKQNAKLDDTLVAFTQTYIAELMHATGLAVEYDNDFDRYEQLKEAVSSIDLVFEHLKELHGADEMIPSEVTALVEWMFATVLDMVIRINALEGQNPEYPAMRIQVAKFYGEHLED